MKFIIQMIDPEGVNEGIDKAIESYYKEMGVTIMPNEEYENLCSFVGQWQEYGFMDIEFDTEMKTARVMKINEQSKIDTVRYC